MNYLKSIRLVIIAVFLSVLSLPVVTGAEESQSLVEDPGESKVKVRTETEKPDDSVVDILIGSPPQMPTENGLLILRAFHDSDGNGRYSKDEIELENELLCVIDKLEYRVPAFIPGLAYNGNYSIDCTGESYRPAGPIDDVFIARRGQIIKIDIPCQRGPGSGTPESAPARKP